MLTVQPQREGSGGGGGVYLSRGGDQSKDLYAFI